MANPDRRDANWIFIDQVTLGKSAAGTKIVVYFSAHLRYNHNISYAFHVTGDLILKQVKREKSTSTKGHYVTNAVLLPEVIRAKELGYVTTELIRMIQMIAERYSRKHNFVGYSFREDMVSAAVANLCNTALKFDLERGKNPFAFYTTAIHNSFLQYMSEEKKQRNIRDTLLMEAGSNPSFNFLEKEKDDSSDNVLESDNGSYEPARQLADPDAPFLPQPEKTGGQQFERSALSIIRADQRAPGPVTRISKDRINYDPVTGIITYKDRPDVIIAVDPHAGKKPKKNVVRKKPVGNRRPFQKKKVVDPTPTASE